MKRFWTLWILCFGVLTAAVAQEAEREASKLTPKPAYKQIAKSTATQMPRVHMSHEELSDGLARRIWANFIRSLDFDRSFLMEEDIRALRANITNLDDNLKKGDITFAYDTFELFRERARNRVAFTLKLLDEGFDAEIEEDYTWKRKDAAWVKNEKEWDELWRKKVKNEYVGILVSREMRKIRAEKDAEKTAGADEAKEESQAEKDRKKNAKLSPEELIRKRYEQFLEVLDGHDAEYVLQIYLNSFTSVYDTHSSYFSPRTEEDFDINMSLSLTGIGAMLQYEDGAAKVMELIKGGPAERDGRLKPGDRIIAVAQGDEEPVDVMYWPLYKTVRLIRGEKGSTVVLSVIPASDPTGSVVRKIDIVRDEIKLEEKAAKADVIEHVVDGKTLKLGVLYLPDFYADLSRNRDDGEARSSASDVQKLLQELNEKEVDGLVFDLRDNGGGSLSDCVRMTGFFIDNGPIVQVRAGDRVSVLSDTERGADFEKPVVILISRQSASASEILAAALQDYGRAVLVGDSKTHGKGTVQSLMPLDRKDPTQGALKVTTAAFYRVDGRSTQLKGVTPDIVIRTPTDVMEMGEEYLDNVLPWTWVRPTQYAPVGNLSPMVKDLKEKSEKRLAEDEEFKVYEEHIKRLAERVQRQEVSLNYATRLKSARSEWELDQELEKKLGTADENADAGERNDDIDPENDLVLKEGLKILSDIITYTGPEEAPAAGAAVQGM